MLGVAYKIHFEFFGGIVWLAYAICCKILEIPNFMSINDRQYLETYRIDQVSLVGKLCQYRHRDELTVTIRLFHNPLPKKV